MKIKLTNKKINEIDADFEILFVNSLKKVSDKKILEKMNFEPKDETSVLLLSEKKIYTGYEEESYDSFAVAVADAVKKVKKTNYKVLKINIDSILDKNFVAIVEGAFLSAYEFNKYKSKNKKQVLELHLCVKDTNLYADILKNAEIVTKAVNKTRDMVNTAPADFYPAVLADESKQLAEDVKITCEIKNEKYLKANGMNAMYSVGKASTRKSKLVHLTYKPKNATKKIVLVGKGVTYDAGGMSLKPSEYMVTMKSDKSGACAVVNAIWAIAKLGLNIEVHAIAGAVENMVAGNAYKPDDVLTAKNGKTIEIRNTDAEGRLVLADCLCYAQDEIKDIDYIFDFATLTGACVVGVGEYTTGIMGNSNKLKKSVVESASEAGEYATALDFNRFLRKTVKSEIADICNIASTRYGGALTAGIFLDNFINEEYKNKWIHFDIAGPAFVEKDWGYNPHGASGAAVRTIVNFVKKIK